MKAEVTQAKPRASSSISCASSTRDSVCMQAKLNTESTVNAREQMRAAAAAQTAAAHVTAYSMPAELNIRADQHASGTQQLNTKAELMQAGLERAAAAEATAAAHMAVCAHNWGSTPRHESRSKARRAKSE